MIEKHDRALEYDLMTRTGRTLSEYEEMGAAGTVALISFIRWLPPDSALYRDMNPNDELSPWYTTKQTNRILADLFDAFVAANTKKGHKPKTYPRPRKKETIGKGAIKIKDFWKWWNKER